MKKLFLFLCFVCAFKFVSAQVQLDFCKGDSYDLITVDSTDTVVYFHSFTDSISYLNNRIYDTVVGGTVNFVVDTDMIYEIVSINGDPYPYISTIIVTVLPVATISIPPASIHHVTCPDGHLYPYRDGSFHVDLDNPVQDYEFIDIFNDSTYYFIQVHDSVTLTDLRAGTYQVVAYGTNGCEYHDSVTIEQPDPWVDHIDQDIIDSIRCNEPAYVHLFLTGGTTPYTFNWKYELDSTLIFPNSSELYCPFPGVYHSGFHDANGCYFNGVEEAFIVIYELVTDTIHMELQNTIICPGQEIMLSAHSRGYGDHTWIVGDYQDSANYYTGVDPMLGYISRYLIDSLTESQYVTVSFVDENGCETSDSTWVEIYNSNISLSILTATIVTDSSCTVHVSPPGGNLYLDDTPIAYSIPANFTFSTAGISVGEHMLKYSGIFGSEIGLACEDEISLPIQVEMNPLVPNWEYDISIYPNPATTTLNLVSTEISDFELSILDMTGKVIKTEKMLDQNFTIDVSDLSSGIYMLRLVSQEGASKIVKFVKR